MSEFTDQKPTVPTRFQVKRGLKKAIRDGAHRRDHKDPNKLPMHFSNLSASVRPVSKNLNFRTAVSFFAKLIKEPRISVESTQLMTSIKC